MVNFSSFGKLLIFFGLLLTVLGIFILFGSRIPFLGRLPGDIVIERKTFSFYFPVVTCLFISAILSFVLWFLSKK